jgi:putative flippase GtrA
MTASSFVDAEPLRPKWRIVGEFARYFACSAVALGTDFALFGLGLRLGFGYPVAAAAGFIVGLWLAYRLSIRFVFRARAVADERVEFVVFAGIGLLGLLLTELLLWLLVAQTGLSPMPAKLASAGAVFCFNFLARKYVLFTRHGRAAIA